MNPSGERALAERYDAVLLDLDGVIYRGHAPIEGAAATLSRLRELGIPRLFLTNNSSRTPGEVARSLRTLGIEAEPKEVLTSGVATAALLRRQGLAGATAFVIGEAGVREPLEEAGLRLARGEPRTADLVVVGLDRSVDYAKLRTAALLLQRGARLVATNSDISYPAPDGLWPGAGAILAAVTTATGAVPEVVGKPERPLFREAAEATGATSPLVVGDRLETDVAGAEGMGWDSLLVMSGASTLADLIGLPHEPTYIGRDVSSLLDDRPPARFRQARVSDVLALRDLLEAASLGAAGVEDRLAQTLVAPERSPG
nr:HAD-IIA family hydrolase [Actinomycetota bacterium]